MYMVIFVGLTIGTLAMLTALAELIDFESLIRPYYEYYVDSEENTYS